MITAIFVIVKVFILLKNSLYYNEAKKLENKACVPFEIKTIMIVLFKILTLFHFKAIIQLQIQVADFERNLDCLFRFSIAKGTQVSSFWYRGLIDDIFQNGGKFFLLQIAI